MKKELSEAEWHVMESLWEYSPKVGSQIVTDMAGRTGWSRSTTLTMLRRMTEKGLILCDESGEVRKYSSLVNREEAVIKETDDFLNRVYKGSVGLMMSTLTKKQNLTQEEIQELYEILKQAEHGKKTKDKKKKKDK